MSVTGLGWCTESTIQPKKTRKIDGVSQNTMLDLKAALYEREEQVKSVKLGGLDMAQKKRIARRSRLDPKFCGKAGSNAGLQSRMANDEDDLEEEEGRDVEASLRKKAELYEKMVGGGRTDELEAAHDGGRFLVDFFAKDGQANAALSQPSQEHLPWDTSASVGKLDLVSADMLMESERHQSEIDGIQSFIDETKGETARQANVDLLKGLTQATNTERQKQQNGKRDRDQARKERLERIKAKKRRKKGGLSSLAALLNPKRAPSAVPAPQRTVSSTPSVPKLREDSTRIGLHRAPPAVAHTAPALSVATAPLATGYPPAGYACAPVCPSPSLPVNYATGSYPHPVSGSNYGSASAAEPSPGCWQPASAPDGRVYYFNVHTHATSWTRPPEPSPAQQQHQHQQQQSAVGPGALGPAGRGAGAVMPAWMTR